MLSDLCLRRPVLAAVMSILIVTLGLAALTRVPVRELPNVDSVEVTVSVDYTGAAPEVVDAQITTLVEGAVSGTSGLRSIESESERGSNRTVLTFDPGRDIDAAASDVRSAVARIVPDLPSAAEQPEVEKNDSEDDPVIWLSMTSERMSPAELTDYADRYVVDQFATIDGVANVSIFGERTFAMRVWLDPRAMAARDVTVNDITAALEANNVELPAGEITTGSRSFQVRTDTRLASVEAFRTMVVGERGGSSIELDDVADVELGVENDNSLFRANAEPAIGLAIMRQSRSNVVVISDSVREKLPEVADSLPEGTTIGVGNDEAVFVRGSIYEVLKTLAIAVGLVVGVIAVFLASLRATLVPSVTIPIALIGACAGIAVAGFSVNILTLFALILAIGLVVDDAIVVLENIQRRIQGGESPLQASALGARQVTFAVLATSATLIAVFVPLSFLQGEAGRLFVEFGFVMAIAVAVSTFVALSLCPVLAAALLSGDRGRGRFGRAVDAVLAWLNRGYRALLTRAIRFPALVLGIAAFVAASAYTLYQDLPGELTPKEDRGYLFVSISAPQGSNVAYTDRATRQVEEIIGPYLQDGTVASTISLVGRWGELRRAFVIAIMPPWDERDITPRDVVAEIEPELDSITLASVRASTPSGLGVRGGSSPLQAVVGAPSFEQAAEWSGQLADLLRENPNLSNVEREYSVNKPGFSVSVDRRRARDLGIDARTISQAMRTLVASAEVTEFTDRGRRYPVVVQAREADRDAPSDLSNITLRTSGGEIVSLDGLVTVASQAAPRALNRFDRLPSVEVSASLEPGYDLGAGIDYVDEVSAELPEGARIAYDGQAREFLDTSSGVAVTFVLALVIVFLVLAAQFESFVLPVVIMLSVPLAMTGAFFTLLVTGQTLNIYTQVGLVLLIGLMAKNGILIIEFANQLRDEGHSVREAIIEGAVVRLRPVLMTVISTVLGAVPLALSTGAGAESRQAIGIVIIGGFATASLLTLFLTPVLYDLLARFTRPRGAIAQRLGKAIAQPGVGA